MIEPVQVSIVTPTYNAVSTLHRCIESIQGQGVQHVIADAGSTDETASIVLSAGESIAKFISEPDKGIYDGMNKGVKLADGKWIGVINADDQLAPGAVKALLATIRSRPDAEIIHGKLVYVDEQTGLGTVLERSSDTSSPIRRQVAYHPAMFVKREVYEEIGNFDLDFPIAADWEFMVRAVKAGKIFVYIDTVMAIMHGGGASSLSPVRNRIELFRILRKHGGNASDYMWLAIELVKDIKKELVRKFGLGQWSSKRAELLRAGGYQDMEEIERMLGKPIAFES